MKNVAVLFAREDSIYHSIPGCDVYDIKRNALNYRGSFPVIAHPPCRAWGKLKAFSKHSQFEKDLSLFAIDEIRRCGGVLEHPIGSSLWDAKGISKKILSPDSYGGFTLHVNQFWFGHKAEKASLLYICGVLPGNLPAFPLVFNYPSFVVNSCIRRGQPGYRPEISKADRERTPLGFAHYLISIAEQVRFPVRRSTCEGSKQPLFSPHNSPFLSSPKQTVLVTPSVGSMGRTF